MKYRRIVCATDFLLNGDHAVRYALAFTKRFRAELLPVHVIDNRPAYFGSIGGLGLDLGANSAIMEAVREHAEAKMETCHRQCAEHGVNVRGRVLAAAPAHGIVEAAVDFNADLIVVGTHGRSALERLVLGSTCEGVIRRSPIPVLTIKHPQREFVERDDTIDIDRVLCPCDFSEFSRLALPYAAEICTEFDATLVLEHVVHPVATFTSEFATAGEIEKAEGRHALQSLEALADTVTGVHTELTVLSGVPAKIIAETAERDRTDLIVMTTHGRAGFTHALLGSVAEKVIRLAPCPVLTIRPAERVAEKEQSSVRQQAAAVA